MSVVIHGSCKIRFRCRQNHCRSVWLYFAVSSAVFPGVCGRHGTYWVHPRVSYVGRYASSCLFGRPAWCVWSSGDILDASPGFLCRQICIMLPCLIGRPSCCVWLSGGVQGTSTCFLCIWISLLLSFRPSCLVPLTSVRCRPVMRANSTNVERKAYTVHLVRLHPTAEQ